MHQQVSNFKGLPLPSEEDKSTEIQTARLKLEENQKMDY